MGYNVDVVQAPLKIVPHFGFSLVSSKLEPLFPHLHSLHDMFHDGKYYSLAKSTSLLYETL